MKTFIPLENNPEVMTQLATTLGLSPTLAFHDVYSLSDPTLLSQLPRPAHALLVTIPMTPSWRAVRLTEDSRLEQPYRGQGPTEPVLWFKQTIGNACGLIGLLHCALNGPAAEMLVAGTELARLQREAVPLAMVERARLLEDSHVLEAAHGAAAVAGNTVAPRLADGEHVGNHFVAFVKGRDGHLWELEGSRRGPLDRGGLGGDEDVLSQRALDMGINRYIRLEEEAGGKVLRFSCVALAAKEV